MAIIEYQVLQFLTSSGPLFVALGVVLVSGILVFGVGRNRRDAVDELKKRGGEGYIYQDQADDNKKDI